MTQELPSTDVGSFNTSVSNLWPGYCPAAIALRCVVSNPGWLWLPQSTKICLEPPFGTRPPGWRVSGWRSRLADSTVVNADSAAGRNPCLQGRRRWIYHEINGPHMFRRALWAGGFRDVFS